MLTPPDDLTEAALASALGHECHRAVGGAGGQRQPGRIGHDRGNRIGRVCRGSTALRRKRR